jgi:hypothetical protein
MIKRVLDPPHETRFGGTIDEADRTVVPQQEGASNIADGRAALILRPAHCEQELMLGRGDPDALGLLLAPTEEAPQCRAEQQEPPIVSIREITGRHRS